VTTLEGRDGFADCRYQPPRPLCLATMPAAAVAKTALDSRQPCYAFWALAELCNELCEHVPYTLSTQAQVQTQVYMQVGSKQQAAVESICPEHHIAAEHSPHRCRALPNRWAEARGPARTSALYSSRPPCCALGSWRQFWCTYPSAAIADSIAPRCLDELPRPRPPALKLKRCQHSRPQAVDDSEVTSESS